ncbi:vacuolar ATP synthase subunit S1-domain-containing protein [Chaetomium tenue]|uniref:Vacuolar ATP synthase subunit S1-domain-containing protein n=1 Tax=Chaetomium tenue TaxID=1854479 RepID=A0ACB7PHA5_9PEZI|nr:vacuolar ATP synthase subunit S1-domain-containing protein [Chaetomium globosum]
MKLSTATTLLACAASQAQAFSDSSPFVLLSTAKFVPVPYRKLQPTVLPQPAAHTRTLIDTQSHRLSTPPSTSQLQTASQVLTTAKSLLASCPTKRYLLVSQPNMHAADIRDDSSSSSSSSSSDSCRMPNLCRAARRDDINSWAVAETIGRVSGQPLEEYIAQTCGEGVSVQRVELRQLPAASDRVGAESARGEVLGDNDHELGKLLDTLEGEDYTVVVFSDPSESKAYEPEFSGPVHMDMKRSVERQFVARSKSDSTDNLPLFEKYQFFTPGIFMAFIVLAVVLSILGVGLKALSSLEVSYGAFDKDMGPAAQKKQM